MEIMMEYYYNRGAKQSNVTMASVQRSACINKQWLLGSYNVKTRKLPLTKCGIATGRIKIAIFLDWIALLMLLEGSGK